MASLRRLLHGDAHYAQVLAAFEAIDRGRRVLEDSMSLQHERAAARDDVWEGNVAILEHEQRALVQPNFDRLSGAFARIASMGSASTFEVRGLRQGLGYFTSFYLYSFTRGLPRAVSARTWPTIIRFEDRWPWLTTNVVPRFRRLDANQFMIQSSSGAFLTKRTSSRRHPVAPAPRWESEQAHSVPTPRRARDNEDCRRPLPKADQVRHHNRAASGSVSDNRADVVGAA